MTAISCDYCGQPAELLPSSAPIYNGRDYGPVWFCSCEPAWVGCHKGTYQPLGRIANASLRRAKQAAHRAFDPIWKDGHTNRKLAYMWLAQRLGISKDECHIGMFDEETCATVVEVSRDILRDLREEKR